MFETTKLNKSARRTRRIEKARPKVKKFLNFSTSWLLFTAGLFTVIYFTIDIYVAGTAFAKGYFHSYDYAVIVLRGIGGRFLFVAGAVNVRNNAGCILISMGLVALGLIIVDPISRTFFLSFPLATVIWYSILGIGIFAIGISPFHITAINLSRRGDGLRYPGRIVKAFKRKKLRFLASIGLAAILGTTFLVWINRDIGAHPVTIYPKDYQIEFRFWAEHSNTSYLDTSKFENGTAILESMDRHGAVIQNANFHIPDENNETYSFSTNYSVYYAQRMNETLGWFSDNYPGIKFQIYASGIPAPDYEGGAGNNEASIYTPANIRRLVDVCRDYNISNVIGLYSDWEGGADIANHSLNAWNQALLTDAFAHVRTYFPNWTLQACSGTAPYWDFIDDDADMQYYRRYNIFNPRWDEYAPMIYRCGNQYATDAAPYTYNGAWDIYVNCKILVDGVLDGDENQAGMWLGITGYSCYNQNYTVYEHGEPIDFGNSTGFDNLARDILILKHFGIPSVSIFEATYKDIDGNGTLIDFFNHYGEDALDRLNATVNGDDATEPFVIYTDPYCTLGKKEYATDYMLNFNRVEWLPVAGVYVLAGFLFLMAGLYKEIIAKITRKNRKD